MPTKRRQVGRVLKPLPPPRLPSLSSTVSPYSTQVRKTKKTKKKKNRNGSQSLSPSRYLAAHKPANLFVASATISPRRRPYILHSTKPWLWASILTPPRHTSPVLITTHTRRCSLNRDRPRQRCRPPSKPAAPTSCPPSSRPSAKSRKGHIRRLQWQARQDPNTPLQQTRPHKPLRRLPHHGTLLSPTGKQPASRPKSLSTRQQRGPAHVMRCPYREPAGDGGARAQARGSERSTR